MLKKNTEYSLYLKGLTSYKKNKKKIFNLIKIKKEKKDHNDEKYCYIYFYNLIKKYPHSKYLKNIKKKQKKIYNQITITKYSYYHYFKNKNNSFIKNSILINLITNYTKSKIIKKIFYNIEENIKNI